MAAAAFIYGASKAALDTMSMALARVLAPEIRVIVIAPGMVHTGFVPGRTEETMAAAAAATPLKRAVEADDVGQGGNGLRNALDAHHRIDVRSPTGRRAEYLAYKKESGDRGRPDLNRHFRPKSAS